MLAAHHRDGPIKPGRGGKADSAPADLSQIDPEKMTDLMSQVVWRTYANRDDAPIPILDDRSPRELMATPAGHQALGHLAAAAPHVPIASRLMLPNKGINMPGMGNSAPVLSSRPARRKAAAGRADAPTSLADALFTTTQQRVLALLFGQPSRSFFASELIDLTGSGSGAVQRELKRLTSSGLVTIKRIGKQKHYQANPECPVFDELCAVVRKTVAMAEPIQQALSPLERKIELALIYGSVAKGTDTARSDIDLLVVADGLTLEALYSALAPVEASLDRKISPTLYTTREYAERRAAANPFLTRVLQGEHLVLMGSAGA